MIAGNVALIIFSKTVVPSRAARIMLSTHTCTDVLHAWLGL